MIQHIVTPADIEANPELLKKGVQVGDRIEIPEEDTEPVEEKEEEAEDDNADRIETIKLADGREFTGIRHMVTQEDIDANGGSEECAGVIEVGDVVHIPLPTEIKEKVEKAVEAVSVEVEKKESPQSTGHAPAIEESSSDEIADPVISVVVKANLKHNGENYKPGQSMQIMSSHAKELRAAGVIE